MAGMIHRHRKEFAVAGLGLIAGLFSAATYGQDVSALLAAQALQNNGGAINEKTVLPRQTGPVVVAPVSTGTPPGFANSKLRPFGDGLLGSGRTTATPVDLPIPADYVVGAGDTVELRLFGKENRSHRLVIDRSGSITLPEIGPLTVAGMTYEAMSQTILERISKQKIGVEATVTMGALRSIQVSMMGDVNQPGAYTVDALTTITNALIVGGGIKPNGSLRRVELRRGGKTVAHLDLYASLLRGDTRNDLRLQAGDVIFVPSVGRRVGIAGEVLRPAIYELLGERSIDDVLKLAGGLLPTAYTPQSKLERVTLGGQRQLSDLSLAIASQRQQSVQNGDIITIGSAISRTDRSVTVNGATERPGSYEWRPGMTLAQLIPDTESLRLDAYRAFAVIQRLDVLTGTPYFKSVNLLAQLQGKANEPLQKHDKVIILAQQDVDFLSSAKVQAILAGRIAQALNGAQENSGIQLVNEEKTKSQDLKAEQAGKADLSMPLRAGGTGGIDRSVISSDRNANPQVNGTNSAGTFAGSTVEGENKPQVLANTCAGLQELATLIDGEGGQRFRSAMMVRGSGKEVDALKVMACTELYQSIPTLLPFVIEQSISLRGEVKSPGILPVPEQFPLELAIRMRGGLTRAADLNGIELSRPVTQNNIAQLQRSLLSPQNYAATQLLPGDMVMVRRQVTEQDNGVVRLSGEFEHPGSYDIKRGERLSEVIARAGGITRHAYPYGAVFLRERIKTEKAIYYGRAAQELTSAMALSMSRVGSTATAANPAGMTAMQALITDLKNTTPSGRMVVEADPTSLLARPELDVVLEPGDEVIMPKRPASVLVMGEVLSPGAVQFQSGLRAGDYLGYAGGTTRAADENRAYLILPNGAAEPVKLSSWNFQPTQVPPGSVLYIPRDPLPFFTIDYFNVSLSVIKDLALTAAALKTITK